MDISWLDTNPSEVSLASYEETHQRPTSRDTIYEHVDYLPHVPSRPLSQQTSATIPPSFSKIHEIVFIAVVCSSQLLTQASLAQTIVASKFIDESLHIGSPALNSWNTAAYSLTTGTFILISGRAGDLYGHKKLFIIGWMWFAVWSLLAGFSVYSNQRFFACCRAFQGLGPSIILPNGVAILGRTYPPGPKKNLAMALFGAAAPNGFLIGTVFTGILSQLAWWPWSFWANAAACLVSCVLSILVIPPMPIVRLKKVELKELDPLGALAGVGGLVLINFSWNQGPVVGWETVYVYVLLIVGFVCIFAFYWIETRVARYPLIPMSFLPALSLFVFACIALGWSSFGIWIFYLWQLWLELRNQTILKSAAQLAPTGVSGAIAAVTTGFMLSKGVRPGYIMLISLLMFAGGNILLATTTVNQIYWANTFVSQIVTPWGMDLSFPAAVIILSDTMPKEHQGLAASLVTTVVNYSISLGLGFAGTVEVHVNDGGKDVLKGYRGAWYTGIGLAGLGVIVSLIMILSLRGKEQAKKRESMGKGIKLKEKRSDHAI